MFEEEQCTAVVPKERVMNFISDKGDGFDIKWANKKLYKGKVLLFG